MFDSGQRVRIVKGNLRREVGVIIANLPALDRPAYSVRLESQNKPLYYEQQELEPV